MVTRVFLNVMMVTAEIRLWGMMRVEEMMVAVVKQGQRPPLREHGTSAREFSVGSFGGDPQPLPKERSTSVDM